MGVPVVVFSGDRHMSRVGNSLLTAVGHPEWIANTAEDYVRIAAELAAARDARCAMRNTLRDDMRRGPLLDHKGQTERFAQALRDCWIGWCSRNVATS
jgi:predicted O-linked N-acetylglucosamine transferase (SPINDLY family)